MARQRSKRKRSRGNSGQFLIMSAMAIVILMIMFASLLAYTSVSGPSLETTNFRKVTTEVTLNFRAALATALAETSMELDREARIVRYSNYTSLGTYPAAAYSAFTFMTQWQEMIYENYPGYGLNLSLSDLDLRCDWSGSPGYSEVDSALGLDILAYRFYGWRAEASIGLNLTVLNLNVDSTDGETTAFYFQVLDGRDMPITDISTTGVRAFFKRAECTEFTLSKGFNMTYLGNGYYLIKFLMYSSSILENLDTVRDFIRDTMTPSDFKDGSTAQAQLVSMVEQTIAAYGDQSFTQSYYDFITAGIRPKLVPGGVGSWVVDTPVHDTTDVLGWIDVVRTQVLPIVRIALQDSSGLVVGACETLLRSTVPDLLGPRVTSAAVSPNPTGGLATVSLTAWIDDLSTGFSDMVAAEFFVGTQGANGTGTIMNAEDGNFDSPSENVGATLNVSGWAPGSYLLYVHGKDSAGHWGQTNSVTLNVTQALDMYIYDMTSQVSYNWYYRSAVITVTVWDAGGRPVQNAWVYGTWSGSVSGSYQILTDSSGRASFTSGWTTRRPATFTLTVTNIVKLGWTYNPALNRVSSSLTVLVP